MTVPQILERCVNTVRSPSLARITVAHSESFCDYRSQAHASNVDARKFALCLNVPKTQNSNENFNILPVFMSICWIIQLKLEIKKLH